MYIYYKNAITSFLLHQKIVESKTNNAFQELYTSNNISFCTFLFCQQTQKIMTNSCSSNSCNFTNIISWKLLRCPYQSSPNLLGHVVILTLATLQAHQQLECLFLEHMMGQIHQYPKKYILDYHLHDS